jgi:hypothetical protein
MRQGRVGFSLPNQIHDQLGKTQVSRQVSGTSDPGEPRLLLLTVMFTTAAFD